MDVDSNPKVLWRTTLIEEVSPKESGAVASYDSVLDVNGEVHTKIEVNGKVLEAKYSEEQGLKSIKANTVLDERDKLVLKDLFAQIKASENPNSSLQTFTASFTDYISESPVGHTIPTRTFDADLSLYNEGVKCIKKGQNVYGQWDTASGQVRGEWVRTDAHYGGSYGCMGRCGGGCGWGAPLPTLRTAWIMTFVAAGTMLREVRGTETAVTSLIRPLTTGPQG